MSLVEGHQEQAESFTIQRKCEFGIFLVLVRKSPRKQSHDRATINRKNTYLNYLQLRQPHE